MKRRENWILHLRRHYLLWNGKGATTDQLNWKVVLRWILQHYSSTAKEKGVHFQSKKKLTYDFMLTKKRIGDLCWSPSEICIQMFVERHTMEFENTEQIAKQAIFCGFLIHTNLFKSAEESENMCPWATPSIVNLILTYTYISSLNMPW